MNSGSNPLRILFGFLLSSVLSSSAAPVNATFANDTTVPVTAASYTATGNTLNLTLNFAPPVGTNLTVVNNTGLPFIGGTFDNLAHGQAITLTYGGITYPFVANYYGGTGNDLVMQWANTRLMGCGSNSDGQLGNNFETTSSTPTPLLTSVDMTGVLAGKTVVSVAAGAYHTLALCADGTLAAWGGNYRGQLGASFSPLVQLVPTLVPMTGALAGKTVVAIAAGNEHSLALCSDGTVAAWGGNTWGQLGTGDYGSVSEPRAVETSGVLAGKKVVAIGAGYGHSLALCSDGTMVAWGYGGFGELGNNGNEDSRSPVAVDTSGVLAGKTVVSISAGGDHNVALCSDGTLVAWGLNGAGQLGNNSTTNSPVPVLVDRSGVLAGSGRVASAVVAGRTHNFVRCLDGALAAWGGNSSGQLGDGTKTNRIAPVLVQTTGLLAGRTIRMVCGIGPHSMAFCDDGTVASWGYNYYGQLGDSSTTDRSSPVAVKLTPLKSGERCIAGFSNANPLHSMVIVASPPPPVTATIAATHLKDAGATLNGTVNGSGTDTVVTFEYGRTTAYGTTVAASPGQVAGNTTNPVTTSLSGLLPNTQYHYRIIATSIHGTAVGVDMAFMTTDDATLSGLALSTGDLNPAFSKAIFSYDAVVPSTLSSITVTAEATKAGATITVNGTSVASGATSSPVQLVVGNNIIPITVTGGDSANTLTYAVTVARLPDIHTFYSATHVPVTATSYAATGNLPDLTLNFAPQVGTNLTVVNNTGLAFIQGTFDNLKQGQEVILSYGGISYRFVANYFGGNGNDLILQWANARLLAWGDNSSGQLGNGLTANSNVPVPVDTAGALAGRTVIASSARGDQCLAACAEGTVVTWGDSSSGQAGNGTTNNGSPSYNRRPVQVDQSGVLAGRTVVAVASGGSYCLALCSDGRVAAWGGGSSGQLGYGSTSQRNLPVLVDNTGVLSGKTVVAIAAGGSHNLALCADGTLVSWGSNTFGQLGDNSTSDRSSPVLVNRAGVLAGKTIVAISTGALHSLVLCSDGTLAAWGSNNYGQLGNNSTTNAMVPVLVDRTGVLLGKTVIAISAGGSHNLVLSSDGSMATWGYNAYGQLGNNSLNQSTVPVSVYTSGELAGKTVVGIANGLNHSTARCSDGTLATWGYNYRSQLGNNSTTNSSTPVWVNTGALKAGERFVAMTGATSHSLAAVASSPPPSVTTLAATAVTDTSATFNGSVSAQGSSTSVSFEYGPTTAYGLIAPATPATLAGAAGTAVLSTVDSLSSATTYHYRVVATNAGGTVKGGDMTLTTSTFASLASLSASSGQLQPTFDSRVTNYSISVPFTTTTISVTPVVLNEGARVRVGGVLVASGTASGPLALTVGQNLIAIQVTGVGNGITKTYTVAVTRVPTVFTYNSATDVPVTVNDFSATGSLPTFSLNHAPTTGSNLTVVKNNGIRPILGTFDNLAQGQRVNLTYGGITYAFVANYFGGNGNDLVLQWANNRLFAWGQNDGGQLGLNQPTQAKVPTAVFSSGVLAGKTILNTAVGGYFTLALCSDGTLAAWGYNYSGQLGNNSTTQANVPGLVDRTGVLAGRTVVAVAAGSAHSLALCADGTLAAWGLNDNGQLGNNSTISSNVPVRVDMMGVLSGKTVVTISAGENFSLALCSDGTLAAWGSNGGGQLGNNTTTPSTVPVAVERNGVLSGKTIIAIAAGGGHSLALSADGTLAAWGSNASGQLATGNTTNRLVPESVDRTGVLAGKSIVAIAAGYSHTLALCADGTLVAAGRGDRGELGNGATNYENPSPLLVTRTGVLTGKTITSISAGIQHSLAVCSDGTMAAWGYNNYGQLGNNSTVASTVPVAVNTSALRTGERFVAGVSGIRAGHSLALAASVPPPLATTLAATGIADSIGILNGNVSANGTSTAVSYEYGLTTSYGATVTASPATLTGTTPTATSASLSGLLAGTLYHYRVVATNAGGAVTGDDMTFTTGSLSGLTGLAVSSGSLAPAFSLPRTSYFLTVPYETSSLSVTPVAASATATIKVNNVMVASGSASAPLSLAVGNTLITIVVTAAGGSPTSNYTIMATRLPAAFTFNSATTVPVTVSSGFSAAGNAPTIALTYAPDAGTNLTVVRNTGNQPIQGVFDNLAQGQVVNLTFDGMAYPFVANYFGGTGNDLVLHWANNRLMVWGRMGSDNQVPVPVGMTGILSQKTVTATATGSYHNLVLCSDGTLAAWGSNYSGQLGNGGTTSSTVPVMVDRTGVLAGKTVIAICSGYSHGLALCSDGTLAAWGSNSAGQLGNNTYLNALLPVLVDRSGVLADKSIIGIAAGTNHSLALCADGTLAAWGNNSDGQLGNGTTIISPLPIRVNRTGGLAGKTVTAIAANASNSMAVCSDGSLATWGDNSSGQLGNNTTTDSSEPVAVVKTGVLSGKTIIAAASGRSHGLALCLDGTLAAWGKGSSGQLGNGSTATSKVPVLVDRSGVLNGKTVTGITAGIYHNVVVCTDGTLAAWGSNSYGELGNNSKTNSSVPVLSSTTSLRTGERFISATSGDSYDYGHCIGVVASPPRPVATTLAATAISETGVTLNASVNPNGTTTDLTFQYGPTSTYDTLVTAVPATISGTGETSVTARIEGLAFGTTYHYRVVAANPNDTAYGDDMTFTTPAFATLSGLSLSQGSLVPAFSPTRLEYHVTVPFATAGLTVTPVATDAGSTIQVNGASVATGAASDVIGLAVGNTVIQTLVTGANPGNTKTYTTVVTRMPEVLVFQSPAEAPVTASDFAAAGDAPGFALNFAPPTGAVLTIVRNTGTRPIQGIFGNLAQGQPVSLTYRGVTYSFVADYFGGTGNDLVLQWANMKLWAWGDNFFGQLGNNSTNYSSVPLPVVMNGVFAGKTVTAASVGANHSLALCVDGSVVAWGLNNSGEFGNGTNESSSASLPVLTDLSGVLAGKRVTALAAGNNHSLALCSDGTLATWGGGGILGNGTTAYAFRPVLVDQGGVLIKKSVIAISSTYYHVLVLCSDGTVASWGSNGHGQLGNNSLVSSNVPVLVDMTGVLAGKQIAAISAGSNHSLVRCTDGTLAAWGGNFSGQLGNNSLINSSVPVLVDMTGVLAGKTVVAISAGSSHSLALCSDGTLAAWGGNADGELGDNSVIRRPVPVSVSITGPLSGKSIRMVSTGDRQSLALFTDGTLAAWGRRYSKLLPTLFDTSTLPAGEQILAGLAGPDASHSLALSGAPPPPGAMAMAASGITATGATLNGTANGSGVTTTVAFEFGLTTAYGSTVAATPATVGGPAATAVSSALGGLTAGTTYHYRVVVTNPNGTGESDDITFTTLSDNPRLAALTLGDGTMRPAFETFTTNYIATVPFATAGLTVKPTTEHPGASVKVNGVPVASGTPSGVVPLAVGNNTLTTRVTAEDGTTTMTYTIIVNRLPRDFVFNSASDVPVTANGFTTGGYPVNVKLNFAPAPGTILAMVNNSAPGFIHGRFGNLAQGQRVSLPYGGMVYDFVANYFGGTGNDLVLQWAGTKLTAWGNNNYGQLGDSGTVRRLRPVDVDDTGVLEGKTIVAVSVGYLHSLALCSDGTLGSWGYNAHGQLGDGNSKANSNLPVAVDLTGLNGRTVIAISSGPFHNLALCEDGSVAAWGYNNYGQLGTGNKLISSFPVLVDPVGALAGKQVVAVAAAAYHSFALCSDGTVAAWGYNDEGELGDGTTAGSMVPVAVDTTGILSGRKVAMISAGQYHMLARCTDGTVVSWGYNNRGQLGNSATIDSASPVEIGSNGALAGKSVVALGTSGSHSLALCSDGSLAAWGYNNLGQLGATGISQSTIPVTVTLPQALAGRVIGGISAGAYHNLVRFTDGAMTAWGDNANGQLGNNSTLKSPLAVLVDTSALEAGGPAMLCTSGSAASHNLAVVALPAPAPTALELWRAENFGMASANGSTGDCDDCDHDGIPNLVEYAFGLDPNANSAGELPQARRIGDRVVLEFSKPQGVSGIGYGAEWSPNLQPGSWKEIPDSGSGDEHVFSMPVDAAPNMFLRLRVRVP